MRPVKDIEKLIRKINVTPDAKMNQRTLDEILKAQEKAESLTSAQFQPNIWRIIMKSRITKLVAAAVIIFAALIGINQFGGSVDMTSVAWAEVVKIIENIENVMYQTTVEITDESRGEIPQATGITYVSLKYGTRKDMSAANKATEILYLIPKDNIVIGLTPEEKTYTRFVLSPEQAKQMNEKEDPRQIIKQLLSTEYKHIGHDKINGLDVEGIESKGPRVMGGMFENATVRLWVETGTDLPVRVEIEGEAAGGQMQMKMVLYNFKWNIELEPSIFEPNIPSDYTASEKKMPDVSNITEDRLVKGLQVFAELTNGHYPSNLAIMTTMKEVIDASKIKFGGRLTEQDGGQQKYEDILSACGFHAKLNREKKDVAYYGDKVTVEDSSKVLIRWKILDNQYRVVFGNLTRKTVTAEELAELEK
jgi:outer membrane lipoprotein-sorting protein